jgi:hypothetical protein
VPEFAVLCNLYREPTPRLGKPGAYKAWIGGCEMRSLRAW